MENMWHSMQKIKICYIYMYLGLHLPSIKPSSIHDETYILLMLLPLAHALLIKLTPTSKRNSLCYNIWILSAHSFLLLVYGQVQVTPIVTLVNITPLSNFALDEIFDKSIIQSHFLFSHSMLAKYQSKQRSKTISCIKCLKFKVFCNLKLYI